MNLPEWVINPEQTDLQLLAEISYYVQQLNYALRSIILIFGLVLSFLVAKWLYKHLIGFWVKKAFRWMP